MLLVEISVKEPHVNNSGQRWGWVEAWGPTVQLWKKLGGYENPKFTSQPSKNE